MWISFLSTQKCKQLIETAIIWKQISSALIFSTAPQLTNNSSISVKWFLVLRYPLNTLHIITKQNSVRHSRSIFVTTTEIQRFTGYQKLITKTLFVTWNNLKFNQTWKKNAAPNEQPSNVYSCLRWPTIGYCITNAKFFLENSVNKRLFCTKWITSEQTLFSINYSKPWWTFQVKTLKWKRRLLNKYTALIKLRGWVLVHIFVNNECWICW